MYEESNQIHFGVFVVSDAISTNAGAEYGKRLVFSPGGAEQPVESGA